LTEINTGIAVAHSLATRRPTSRRSSVSVMRRWPSRRSAYRNSPF